MHSLCIEFSLYSALSSLVSDALLPKIFVDDSLPEYSFSLLSCVNNYGGFGAKTTLGIRTPYETRDTSQFALDEIFLTKFLQYAGRVNSTNEADFVFVPFLFLQLERMYALARPPCGGPVGRITTTAKRHVERILLTQFIGKLLYRNDLVNKTLVLSMSRVTMTYAKSWLNIKTSKFRLIFFALEKSSTNTIMVPYPTAFHLTMRSAIPVEPYKKTALVTFGSPRLRPSSAHARGLTMKQYGPAFEKRSKKFRDLLYQQLLAKTKDSPLTHILDSRNFSLRKLYASMLDSVFCLQPPGDSPTRRGFYDSILLGCIPVIFSKDAYILNYVSVSDFAVIVNKSYVINRGNILDMLRKISPSVISSYQANISRVQCMMQYSVFDDPNDAFGKVIEHLRIAGWP